MAAQTNFHTTNTATTPHGTWEAVGLALLPYLFVKSCEIAGQGCLPTDDKRLGLLTILPYLSLSLRSMDGTWTMVAIIMTVIALVRWPMIDLMIWLPFYFNLVASFLLQRTTISGIRVVSIRFVMSFLAVVVVAQLFWWLWQRLKEVPSDKGGLGYSLLLAGLILKTLSLTTLYAPMSFFSSPPPFLWQEWLLSFPVILALLYDLLALFFLGQIFIRSGWLPLWFLIVTSPLVYTLRPLLATTRSRRATVPLWDIDLASLLPIRAEFIWLWLALVALAWLTIAGLYHKEKALPR